MGSIWIAVIFQAFINGEVTSDSTPAASEAQCREFNERMAALPDKSAVPVLIEKYACVEIKIAESDVKMPKAPAIKPHKPKDIEDIPLGKGPKLDV